MQGTVQEFRTNVEASGQLLDVSYEVVLADASHDLTQWQGLVLQHSGQALCRNCQAPLRPSDQNTASPRDYCYTCFTSLARCDLCFLSPDRCHFHAGTCREPDWGEQICMQPHTIYLALTYDPKVGITRQGREWFRWADQGASRAIKLASVPTRRMAGVIEAHLRQWLTDRTDWRKLVTGQQREFDLRELARSLSAKVPDFSCFVDEQITVAEAEASVWLDDEQEFMLQYPVREYAPAEQMRLEKPGAVIADKLLGIVGGYLLLSQGVVAMANLTGGHIQIERQDDVLVQEKPQLTLF